jgi:hypothetical protein
MQLQCKSIPGFEGFRVQGAGYRLQEARCLNTYQETGFEAPVRNKDASHAMYTCMCDMCTWACAHIIYYAACSSHLACTVLRLLRRSAVAVDAAASAFLHPPSSGMSMSSGSPLPSVASDQGSPKHQASAASAVLCFLFVRGACKANSRRAAAGLRASASGFGCFGFGFAVAAAAAAAQSAVAPPV